MFRACVKEEVEEDEIQIIRMEGFFREMMMKKRKKKMKKKNRGNGSKWNKSQQVHQLINSSCNYIVLWPPPPPSPFSYIFTTKLFLLVDRPSRASQQHHFC